ncbi:UNVERIFIED_CONTAM: Nudix hydrolase 25 [Sesamum radiatum]|uniref:Nudix hydrolase 25 n=1 Tax=Sesamum radiatum TaxID=300843 RepID=A0AAW2TXI8_SESRA
MEHLPSGYRPNVGVCLINDENKGGIEEGEDPRSAAIRELREETGVVSAEIMDEVCNVLMLLMLPICLWRNIHLHLLTKKVWRILF